MIGIKKKPTKRFLVFFLLCTAIFLSGCKTTEKPAVVTTETSTTVAEPDENTTEPATTSQTDQLPTENLTEFGSNEKIVEFYKKAYKNTLSNGNILGTDYIEIVPKSFKVNGFRNELMDSILNVIFKQLTANNKKIIGLPPQGDELFSVEDVKTATANDDGTNVTLDINVENVDIIAKERAGASSFFTMALTQVKVDAVENGVSWPANKELYDCLDLICSAKGNIVINREKNMIIKADYTLMVSCKMRELSYKAILKDTSVDGEVKYEMHFSK